MSGLVDSVTGELVVIADAEEARRIDTETTAVVAHFNVWSGKMLDQIAAGTVTVGGQKHQVPFDVDTIDQLKTVLASASRSSAWRSTAWSRSGSS